MELGRLLYCYACNLQIIISENKQDKNESTKMQRIVDSAGNSKAHQGEMIAQLDT